MKMYYVWSTKKYTISPRNNDVYVQDEYNVSEVSQTLRIRYS